MSQLQVTTLESNTVSANVITAGQTTVNSAGLYLNSTSGVINSSAVYVGNSTYQSTLKGLMDIPVVFLPNQNLANTNFSNWTAFNVTIESTSEQGVDPAYPVARITDNATNDQHLAYNLLANKPTAIVGQYYKYSVYIKAVTARYATIPSFYEPFIVFDFNTKDFVPGYGGSTGTVSATSEDAGNGWYKITAVYKKTDATVNGNIFYVGIWDPTNIYSGTGKSILVTKPEIYLGITSLVSETVNTQIFTANGTWTKPGWATTGNELVVVHMWGGGGGGQSNSTYVSGGGGGAFVFGYYKASQLGATANVVVGLGGAGGSTNGSAGGSSVFANGATNALTAYGGGGGGAGGGGGGGWLSAGGTGSSGNPLPGSVGGTGGDSTFGGGGVWNANPASGGNSIYGGGAGSGTGGSSVGGRSVYGGGGGTQVTTGGTSVYGGSGGILAATGTAGQIPGGGGGANTGIRAGLAGARGEVRVYTYRVLA